MDGEIESEQFENETGQGREKEEDGRLGKRSEGNTCMPDDDTGIWNWHIYEVWEGREQAVFTLNIETSELQGPITHLNLGALVVH